MNPYAWLALSIAGLVASMGFSNWASRAANDHRPAVLFLTVILILVTLTLFVVALDASLDWHPLSNWPFGPLWREF